MPARDIHESHRSATPLELLFDLISVIAIAAAAAGLHHAISAGHLGEGLLKFGAAFFGVWWAWMNYTWFASAYDNDDVPFRLLTMVIMAGSLTMAAGISAFFESADLTMVVVGYVIMRAAMILLWLRAARYDQARRTTALWYAGGIAIAQVYWVALLFVKPGAAFGFSLLFAVGAGLELAVPVLAEKRGETPWHRHHIIERYGLLTIIVLGETLLSASMALRSAFGGSFNVALVHIALSALVIVFSMWWVYFSRENHLETNDLRRALTWGYGHVFIFASGAAVGAGFAVLVDVVTENASIGLLAGDYAVAVPVALFLLGLWFVRDRFLFVSAGRVLLPVFPVAVLAAPLALGLEGVALVTMVAAISRSLISGKRAGK